MKLNNIHCTVVVSNYIAFGRIYASQLMSGFRRRNFINHIEFDGLRLQQNYDLFKLPIS
jgi:hypothetical protein